MGQAQSIVQSSVDGMNGSLAQLQGTAESTAKGMSSLQEAASKTGEAMAQAGSGAAAASGGFLSMAGAMATGVLSAEAIQEGLKKVYEFAKDAVFGAAELSEKLHNLSESTGISTTGLEKIRNAAMLAGSDFDTVQRSVSQLSLKMLEL